jgi:flagellar basal-body rod protein FlgC
MDFFSALKISGSGLAAEKARVDLAASNLANVDSTRGPDGKPYRRLDPVFEATPFDTELAGAEGESQGMGVKMVAVAEDQTPGKRVYSPGHPDADAQGFITLPNIDPVHETVNLISASNAYSANTTAVETLKTMAANALAIAK